MGSIAGSLFMSMVHHLQVLALVWEYTTLDYVEGVGSLPTVITGNCMVRPFDIVYTDCAFNSQSEDETAMIMLYTSIFTMLAGFGILLAVHILHWFLASFTYSTKVMAAGQKLD